MNNNWRKFLTAFLMTPLVLIGIATVIWLGFCFIDFEWLNPFVDMEWKLIRKIILGLIGLSTCVGLMEVKF